MGNLLQETLMWTTDSKYAKGGNGTMTRIEKAYREGCEAWNMHDVEKTLSYYTDDVVYEDVVAARVMRGKAELKAFLMGCFSDFPDLKIEPKLVFSSGQWAGSEWSMTGTFKGELMGIKPTGKSFSIKGGSITEFQGNKVKRNTDYYDGVTFLRQIGVMP